MHSHQLILERGHPDAEWLLEWDDSTVVLKDPDGLLDARPPLVPLEFLGSVSKAVTACPSAG